MLNINKGAPKSKFLLPKMNPPSFLLNDEDDYPYEKELSIPELNLSDDDLFCEDEDENYNSTKIISVLKCYKDNINANKKPTNDNALLYNRRNSNSSIGT